MTRNRLGNGCEVAIVRQDPPLDNYTKAIAEAKILALQRQIKTLEAVFNSIGKKASGEKCDAIEGLIKETEGVIEEAEGSVAKHAAIIGCCQAVEHYEISRYGTLREWAKALGETKAHELLSEILDQEKAANAKLTNIAITEINKPAK